MEAVVELVETCLRFILNSTSGKPTEVSKSRRFDFTPFYSVRSMTGPHRSVQMVSTGSTTAVNHANAKVSPTKTVGAGSIPLHFMRSTTATEYTNATVSPTKTVGAGSIPLRFMRSTTVVRKLIEQVSTGLNHRSFHPGLPVTGVFDGNGILGDHERMEWIDHDG